MEIKGKVHCFFEQSGTFKREFIKLGIPAEDYDIQNNFGETDHQDDLFQAIDDAYEGKPSLFDRITGDDLIMAFFPCIHFCDAKTLYFMGESISQKGYTLERIMRQNIAYAEERETFFKKLLKLVAVVSHRGGRMVIENPWNWSGMTYLQHNFIKPTIVDNNRMLRGDYFIKPTAYWFIGCENTEGSTLQKDKAQKTVMKQKSGKAAGIFSEERSMISPDYARNFICDFILGKSQPEIDPQLF